MDMSKLDPEIRKTIEDRVRFDSGFNESHSLFYTVLTTCLLKQSYKDAFKNIKQKGDRKHDRCKRSNYA